MPQQANTETCPNPRCNGKGSYMVGSPHTHHDRITCSVCGGSGRRPRLMIYCFGFDDAGFPHVVALQNLARDRAGVMTIEEYRDDGVVVVSNFALGRFIDKISMPQLSRIRNVIVWNGHPYPDDPFERFYGRPEALVIRCFFKATELGLIQVPE